MHSYTDYFLVTSAGLGDSCLFRIFFSVWVRNSLDTASRIHIRFLLSVFGRWAGVGVEKRLIICV